MNRAKIFRRRFDRGMDRLQEKMDETIGTRTATIAKQARQGWMRGREEVDALEKALVRNVQSNSGLYLAGLVALVGLIVAKALFDYRQGRHE